VAVGAAKAVWTDFGGVLTAPALELMKTYCERIGVEPAMLGTATWAVARSFGTDDPMEPLDTPLVSEPEWCRMVEAELRERFGVEADMSRFGERWLEGQRGNPEWSDYLRSLRERGYFVGLLSNMMPGFEPHWRSFIPAAELFDDLVLSCELGMRKPLPAIFELAERRAGVLPGECVLVDDLEVNCEAARAAGWAAVHFTEAARAIELTEGLLAGRPEVVP